MVVLAILLVMPEDFYVISVPLNTGLTLFEENDLPGSY